MASGVKVSGTWRNLAPHAKVSGTWRACNGWVKVSGTWRPWYAIGGGGTFPIDGQSLVGYASDTYDPPFVESASTVLTVNRAGTVTITGGSSPNWIDPTSGTVGDAYEVRLDITSGSVASGTTGAWLALSSNRQWVVEQTGGTGSSVMTGTLQFRPTSGALAASASVSMTAELF